MNAKQIKEAVKIVDFLRSDGFIHSSENKNDFYFLSPLRNENTPSFKVDNDKNIWYDFGIGEGGNIIDLVCKMKNLNVSKAIQFLSDNSLFFSQAKQPVVIADEKKKEAFESYVESKILSVSEVTNTNLLSYALSRRINKETLQKYCKEVHYTVENFQYYAIGFKNDLGCFELRTKYFKRCIGEKHYTLIQNNVLSSDLYVFEGFFDFLSFITLYGSVNTRNFLILNSTSCIRKATDIIKAAGTIYTFLNNDNAGILGTVKIKAINKNVVMKNELYQPHNDLNDFLINKK